MSDQDNLPRVSIGLPVYNGENYVGEAIESVLGQTYQHLELIISDNGSTDTTQAVCQEYAERDWRVRYYRSSENRGASWNYNRTVELAKGDYFRWLAHDDMLAPTLVEKSIAVLDSNPDVVVCFTWTQDIDEDGRDLEVKQSTLAYDNPRAHIRFHSASQLNPQHNCEEVFGLVRLPILRQTQMIANYTDSDRTLLAQLSLYGPFYEIEEPLFLHRIHRESSVVDNPDAYSREVWFDPRKAGKRSLPKWRQLREMNRVIGASPISRREQMQCYVEVARWAKRRRKRLISELRYAAVGKT